MSSFQIPKNGFYMFWFMAVHHVDPRLQLFDSSKELNTTCQMVFDWLMFELNFNMVVMYKYATLVEDILVFVFRKQLKRSSNLKQSTTTTWKVLMKVTSDASRSRLPERSRRDVVRQIRDFLPKVQSWSHLIFFCMLCSHCSIREKFFLTNLPMLSYM